MPSRLKSLTLQGYKTFASRTVFEFSPRVTAIVGPNGSGKSNLADALRWVLGEQSYALLRAHKTEDMIFAGSSRRPRAGMAVVTVVFDNSDGWLPTEFSEVALTRRATRDGQNEYLINGQKVRLREVRELLARSGLADRTYTFIGQGVVDAALALRPEERRQMLEEAAGIGLYRQRRAESLRRLETTSRNLERVQDILAELEPRLRALERQARRAREYEQASAELRLLLLDWYGYHWQRAQEDLTAALRLAAEQEKILKQARARHDQISAQVAELRAEIRRRRAQIGEWHRLLAERHTEIERLTRRAAVLEERVRALKARRAEREERLAALEGEIRTHEEALAEAEAEVQRHEEAYRTALDAREQARLAHEERRRERRALADAAKQARLAVERLARQKAVLEARLADSRRRAAELAEQLRSYEEKLPALNDAVAKSEAAFRIAKQETAKATSTHLTAEEKLAKRREDLQRAEQAVAEAERALSAAKAELAALQARAQVLAEADAALQGYSAGTRWLLSRLKGAKAVRGVLGHHLKIPAEFEKPIAAALDYLAEAVILEKPEPEVLEAARKAPARVALLVLAEARPQPRWQVEHHAGLLGIAADLVEAPPELRPAVQSLLGRIAIVEDEHAARSLLEGAPSHAVAVTLGGEVFLPNGVRLSGKPSAEAPIRRQRERRALAEEIASAEAKIAALEEALSRAKNGLAEAETAFSEAEQALARALSAEREAAEAERKARSRLAEAKQRLELYQNRRAAVLKEHNEAQNAIAKLQAELERTVAELREAQAEREHREAALRALSLDETAAQVAHWETQAALAEQALAAARRRLAERRASLEEARRLLRSQQEELARLADELRTLQEEQRQAAAELAEAEKGVAELQARLVPAQQSLAEAEERLQALEKEAEKAAQALRIAERHAGQAQLAVQRAQQALQSLRGRMEDDLGPVELEYKPEVVGPQPLPLSGQVERLPRVESLPPDAEERIKQLRARLRRLGAVNLEAAQELEEVRSRYEFLREQMEDLERAAADIRRAIAELDSLMRSSFLETFEKVNAGFKEIFTRLFGGGSAQLVLTDPKDVTSTGVEIEVRIPGKRAQRLAVLSGGERSLTAVALIFALLKASPTPFCVLDEVDAMLDEANVSRFRDLLRELSANTQFVVITHNRNTVQVADVIYGVTLAPDATSQVLSLRLDEVTKGKWLRG